MRLTKHDPTGSYWYLADGVSPAAPVLTDGATAFTPGISERDPQGTRYYLADAQGNSRGLSDPSQSGTDGYNWDAFGSSVSRIGTNPTSLAWGEGSGYQTDSDSGLRLLGHRYYDSRTGRFISQDPAGDGDNWYAYCDNDPMDGTDPTGLFDGAAPTPAGYGDPLSQCYGSVAEANQTYNQTMNLWVTCWTDTKTFGHEGSPAWVETGDTGWVAQWSVPLDSNDSGMGGGMIACYDHNPPQEQHESLWDYLKRQFMSGGQADGSHLAPPSLGTIVPNRGIGPSGKPKIHMNRSSKKSDAFQKAKRASAPGRDPMHHANPTVGDPHYHAVDDLGRKIEDGVHYTYPR